MLKVDPPRVRAWIRSGQLAAVNVADGLLRPRFRVSRDALDEFLSQRRSTPPRLRRKRQQLPAGFVRYYSSEK